MQSSITHSEHGTVFSGPDAVRLFSAVSLRAHIRLFAKTGIVPTRGVNGKRMLELASGITGKTYKARAYDAAVSDLTTWIETMRAALPIVDERN